MARSKYQADNGDIRPITLSNARLAVAGAPPAGAVDNQEPVKVSKTNRSYGLRPRRVVLGRVIGTGDNTFTRRVTLPVLTPTAYGSATFAVGAEITYGGNTYTILSKQGEDY